MKKYEVQLEGNNFLIDMDGTIKNLGFYTTRYVEAIDPEDAELKAVQMIREDKEFTETVKNEGENPPMIYLESMDELISFEGINPPGTGYVFYPDDGSD